jgi:pimeloyl-ACP methyl ester carboxylesterase
VLTTYAGGRLFGTRTGDNPPRLLALHGWARTHRDFDALLTAGPGTIDAVALDLPGFGASPEPPEAWGSARYAEEVGLVLGALETPAVVLGHSFGGMVAVQLAVARPDEVKALVLVGVPRLTGSTSARRPPVGYRLTRTLRKLRLVSEARLDAARAKYGSDDYRRAQGVMRQVLVRSLSESLEHQLARLRCPVHLVWGDDDTAAPLAGAEAARDRIPTAVDLTVCAGAGHLVPLTATDALRGVVERALR